MAIVVISRNLYADWWRLTLSSFRRTVFLFRQIRDRTFRSRRIDTEFYWKLLKIAFCSIFRLLSSDIELIRNSACLQETHPQLSQDETCSVFGALRDQGEDRWVIFSPQQRRHLLFLSRSTHLFGATFNKWMEFLNESILDATNSRTFPQRPWIPIYFSPFRIKLAIPHIFIYVRILRDAESNCEDALLFLQCHWLYLGAS